MYLSNQTFGERYNGVYPQLAGVLNFGYFRLPVVTSYSAGTGMNGNADIFVTTIYGAFDRIDGTAWTYLAASSSIKLRTVHLMNGISLTVCHR